MHAMPNRLMIALVAALAVANACHAQTDGKKPRRDPWESFTDAPEVKAYLEQMKAGTLDATSRATLTNQVLPLLEAPANRGSLDRLRRRIREGLLNERTLEAAALETVNAETAKWALARVAARGVDPLAAVNAMLLLGDLRGKDGKPWPGGTPLLASAAADQNLPLAARAAAISGLVRHAEAGATLKGVAAPLLATAITPPVAGSGDAGEWLAARALGLLPQAMPEASPEAAAGLVKLLGDASRSIDVRIRTAEALGRMATAGSTLDVPRTLEGIRGLAIRGLAQDLEAAKDEEFGQSLAAGSGFATAGYGGAERGVPPDAGFGMRPDVGAVGGQPGKPAPPVEPTVIEHDAWRLATLASAVQPAGKGKGLAELSGNATPAARALATKLRENAVFLHEWIHPASMDPKKPAAGRKPTVAGEFGFPGGESGTGTEPTKLELGQALADALADLQGTPPFGAAAAAAAPAADGNQQPASNDPFGAP